ncbi:MAG: helicase-related protein [Acidobacteriota bacterium]|nr:helicase-related protein [Acidobacteriota bacterium]
MESLLRRAVPNDQHIRVARRAAMDEAPYQLEPTRQALRQSRQRILIADDVGLGKTIEAGVLVSELVARGRGQRILVVAVKSMLTQFQKEFWNRFTIPLTRLDSVGIQRVRRRIPSNHNPFHYYDKSIISIDTLKQDREYRTYVENAWWDIIVIDEAHNVAERGSRSLRSQLAKRLAKRSDTLIMLSATPHDGKARSFASLMNMLDPTAIGDPDNFTQEDFQDQGLVIRRFKKDVREQVKRSFRDRKIFRNRFQHSALEEVANQALLELCVRGKVAGGRRHLFSVTLEKALFSSHVACLETVKRRRKQLEREMDDLPDPQRRAAIKRELEGIDALSDALEAIRPVHFAKYQALLRAIRGGEPFRWKSRDKRDRLVVFSERIATLKWLRERLIADLKLRPNQIALLHGGLSDTDQQEMVEAFGNETTPLRLLLASDVASEGINLHHQCHRLIHFDIPWSLMVFAQRNGRVDRYGQRRDPQIVYLLAESTNPTIQGDARVLEVLIEKDEQAHRNIGDPSIFMNQYDVEGEEGVTRRAIVVGESAEAFDSRLTPETNEGDELMALFLGTAPTTEEETIDDRIPLGHHRRRDGKGRTGLADDSTPESLFASDLEYVEAALEHLREEHPELDPRVDRVSQTLTLDAPPDLQARFRQAPPEIRPPSWRFVLTADQEAMEVQIAESRRQESHWPQVHYLWRLNPVLLWLNDRMLGSFGRHEAPVLAGVPGLDLGEAVFVLAGHVANRKGQPLVSDWIAVPFRGIEATDVEPFAEYAKNIGLGHTLFANVGADVDVEQLKTVLPEAVELAQMWVGDEARQFGMRMEAERDKKLKALAALETRRREQIKSKWHNSRQLPFGGVVNWRAKNKLQEVEKAFADYCRWVEDTMTIAGAPQVSVVAVLTGKGSIE